MDYKNIIKKHLITILFAITVIISLFYTNQLEIKIVESLISHVLGYFLIAVAIIIPINMGMGFNFGIGLGGMATQLAIIFVLNFAFTGVFGILTVIILSTVIAIGFGYLHGLLLNKAKGHEMITSFFIGQASNTIYQYLLLFVVGGIIPLKTTEILLSSGVGLKNTLDLTEIIGKTYEIPVFVILLLISIHFIRTYIKEYMKEKSKIAIAKLIASSICLVLCCLIMFTDLLPQRWNLLSHIEFSLLSFIVIFTITLSYKYVIKDRLEAFSIESNNKARILTIIVSTVVAAWGQIIILCDKGMLITYSSHRNMFFYVIPALIIGGATIKHATVKQGLIGLIISQGFFLVTLTLFEPNISGIIQMIVLNCAYVYIFTKRYSKPKLLEEQ